MNRHIMQKGLALLCIMLLLVATLLTGCKPADKPTDNNVGGEVAGEQNNEPGNEPSNAPDNEPSNEPSDKHDHEKPVALKVEYAKESDDTLSCTVKDCQGGVLFTKKGLSQKCIAETITDNVFSLTWLINNKPGGYESVYFDRLNCRASEVITGEQATDGTRLICSETKDGKVTVMIRDLFDKAVYCESATLTDAYTEGEYAVLSAQITDDGQGAISYLADAKGAHRLVKYDLYPDGKKTEAKKTEKTKK